MPSPDPDHPWLDPRLAADTLAAGTLPSGALRLVNDARWLWAMIVPRGDATELHHLSPDARAALVADAARLSQAVERLGGAHSVNVAMLGNAVPQLHCHVVARRRDDPAWPGPVWGHGTAVPYAEGAARERAAELRAALCPEPERAAESAR